MNIFLALDVWPSLRLFWMIRFWSILAGIMPFPQGVDNRFLYLVGLATCSLAMAMRSKYNPLVLLEIFTRDRPGGLGLEI